MSTMQCFVQTLSTATLLTQQVKHKPHTQAASLIPRPQASYPGHKPHTQVTSLIPRPQASYPGCKPHTQAASLIPRPQASYPGHKPHTQATSLIPGPQASYPGHKPHTQVTSLIPRSQASYPGHKPHTQVAREERKWAGIYCLQTSSCDFGTRLVGYATAGRGLCDNLAIPLSYSSLRYDQFKSYGGRSVCSVQGH